MFHEFSYSIWLHVDTKSKLISVRSQVLHHFVCWYVKCVEKVLFRKFGHIYGLSRNIFFILICHKFTQKHSETVAITGAVFFQLDLHMQLSVWDSYGDFYFSNFDLTYFNKYRMEFSPVKCITKYEALTTINWNGSI